FFLTGLIITFFNILILYLLPGNIYSDLAFVFIIIFAFKLLGFTSINIFLYSIFYFLIASTIVIIDNYNLSHTLLDSVSFYVPALFILAFLTYIYESRFERKLNSIKKRKAYSYLFFSFLILFLFSAIFFNRVDIKVHYFNRFQTEKYFQETEVIQVDSKDIYNEMNFEVETPGDYYVIDDYFTIEGWAFDKSDIKGSKIDYVAVYAGNGPQEGGVFLGSCDYGIRRADIGAREGDTFVNSGFTTQIDSNKIQDGIRKLYIYFHSNNFGWKYKELDLIINNNDSFIFEKIFALDGEEAEFEYSNISLDGEEMIIDEGVNVLKSIKFPVNIESNQDYLIGFKLKRLSSLDNSLNFDFFGEGYDDPGQEFSLEGDYISENYKKTNLMINTGNIPSGIDTYFRIFTSSSGSIQIEDLVIYKVISALPIQE
ncbi:hypothetical protein ACFLQQ_01885, partial [Actinomycetota bacterium]